MGIKRKRRSPSRTCSTLRSILMFGGVGFIGFNLFLISRIDPNQKEPLPHHELNYDKLGDFSDVDLSIKPHQLVYEEPVAKVEENAVSTESPEDDAHDVDEEPVTEEEETNEVQNDDKNERAKVHLEEAKQANAHLPPMAVNPLLWQLHSKKKDGGLVQKGQLLEKHRYLMMENTSEPIPKQYVEDVDIDDVGYWVTPTVDCVAKDLVVFIKSRLESFGIREVIRSTWASKHEVNDKSISFIFMVGMSDSKYLNKQVAIEGRDKQDVIVGEFIDHYQNLTMKSLLGIQWFNNECNRSQHFLSIDDDVFPNLNLILSYIKNNDDAKTLNCLYNMVPHAKVTRKGKWSTGWTAYGKEYYPAYCEGACYTMNANTASILYKVAQKTKRDVPVDDAYVTGVLREKMSLIPAQTKNRNLCNHLVNDDQIIGKLKRAWEHWNGE